MKCPLCKNTSHLDQFISTKDLINLWNQNGIDVKRIFRNKKIGKYYCDGCGIGFYFPFFPGDDRFYGDLALWDWYYKHPGKTEYEFASQLAMPGMNVIDVGCGIGEFSEFLNKQVNFLGVELSSKSVEIANSMGRNVKQIDINNSPDNFRNYFDIVTCFQVLEHVVSIDVFITSLINLCKPGGSIIIAVPNNDSFIKDAVNNILNMPPHHIFLWNKRSLQFLANKHNLTIDSYIEENLAKIHHKWFVSVLLRKFFRKILFKNNKVINLTLSGKFLSFFAALLSRFLYFIFLKVNNIGHSSIIVLKKPKYEHL
jgi:2-polyprenyl-3-methyl-5-hydroxy-6-metoxy-1,4-benzoquinol methylase